jgi:hypothetical protein
MLLDASAFEANSHHDRDSLEEEDGIPIDGKQDRCQPGYGDRRAVRPLVPERADQSRVSLALVMAILQSAYSWYVSTRMAEFVYLSCMLTSAACAGLLIRAYRSTRSRILIWSSVCFAGLGLTNALLFIDLVLLPYAVDLAPLRAGVTLVSLAVLVFGLIWDMR